MAVELVYSAEEEAAKKEWGSGLFACCSDRDSGLFCVLSCFCPCVAYSINFHTVSGNGTFSACILHGLVDLCMLTDLFNTMSFFKPYAPLPPIACCLRYTHRRAAANGRERASVSMLKEVFCWGCSMTQVRNEFSKDIEEKKKTIASSSDLLGTLDLVSNMKRSP